MLPPVHVALNVHTDHPAADRPAATPSRPVAAAQPAVAEDRSLPVSAARLGALSASAQLQLGQSFSAFAEAIGKLLDLPRRENETLADYSVRLSQALQSLSPTERTAVERLLNQIVKGQSLRLLTQLLQNPVGPDAARLAVLIEFAAAEGPEQATKAIVQSYRQNMSSPLPSPPAGPPPAQMPSAPPSGSQSQQTAPSASARPPLLAAGEAGPATSPPGPEATTQSARADQTVGRPQVALAEAVAKALQLIHAIESSASRSSSGTQTVSAGSAVTPSAADGHADDATEAPTPPKPETARSSARFAPEAGAAPRFEGDSDMTSQSHAKLEPVPVPVPARTRGEAVRQEQPVASLRIFPSKIVENMRAGPSESLGPLIADAEIKLIPSSLLAPTLPAPDGDTLSQVSVQSDDIQTRGSQPSTANVAQDAEPEEASSSSAPNPQAATAQKTGEPLDQRQLAHLPPGLLPVPREGVPWSQIPYPPGEEEPRREDRKTRAIDAIGDEEDEPSTPEHGFHQEREQDDAEDEASDEAKGENPAGDKQGQPDDFYWRMAGWA